MHLGCLQGEAKVNPVSATPKASNALLSLRRRGRGRRRGRRRRRKGERGKKG
jgi:hypothetical protein